MTTKRTFGLVGDYGSDSEGENEGASESAVQGQGEAEVAHGYLVEKAPKLEETKSQKKDLDSVKTPSEQPWSKWQGVRKEYDDSSLMYKFTQDLDDDDLGSKELNEKKTAAIAAVSDADNVPSKTPEEGSDESNIPVEQTEKFKHMVAEHQRRDRERKEAEQAALDWEIREIQNEIGEERKKWDGVWSDDEGDGAETEAIFRDQKRRNDVLQAVINEVNKSNTKADEGESKLDKYTKKGDGWKRLQLIAQSRVNTDPDKVNQYPSHKFPLKD